MCGGHCVRSRGGGKHKRQQDVRKKASGRAEVGVRVDPRPRLELLGGAGGAQRGPLDRVPATWVCMHVEGDHE